MFTMEVKNVDNEEKLEVISKIGATFLNHSVVGKEFKIRFQEKICRAEIEESTRKYNRLSISISLLLIVIVSILIILQNQLEIFSQAYIIPVILLPVILVLITIGILEFILIRKFGLNALIEKLGSIESIDEELLKIKKEDSGNYLVVKEAYDVAKTIESESQLPGFLLRIFVTISPIKKQVLTKNDLFKFLFYISLGKEKLIQNVLFDLKNNNELLQEFNLQLQNYILLLKKMSEVNELPRFYHIKLEKILNRFNEFSIEKLESYQIDNRKNFEALKLFLKIISKTNVNWVLVGSSNLALQGVKIQANDIDIISTKDEVLKIQDLFKRYIHKEIKYSEAERYRSWFGSLELKGIKIELIGELEFKTLENNWTKSKSLERKEFIEYESYQVPILPIEYEKEFYIIMKRENDSQKIKKIEEYLKREGK
ncbi:MAG: hypothetical protein EAX90_08145 [Candidatus Heimdallarchaeota archaeon]|nr:hypothetical protein [Candidatus Heimdallarchaeota archaeon]